MDESRIILVSGNQMDPCKHNLFRTAKFARLVGWKKCEAGFIKCDISSNRIDFTDIILFNFTLW